VEPAGTVKLATDHAIQPNWKTAPSEDDYRTELERHPRSEDNIPDWFAEHLDA
jgi:hypothetical protein